MSETEIRIGILGAGGMAGAHAAVWAGLPQVRVAGVFSRDPERARAIASQCGTEVFASADALIATVDAVDVCVPSAVHSAFVIPALDAGRHVFCETPMALTLEDARAMRDAARRSGRLLQIGLLMRSVQQYAHLKTAADSGTYGALRSVLTYRLGSYLQPGAPDHKPHYSDPSTELMTFDFDFTQWLMGTPARLAASAVRLADGTPGEISAILTYDDGRHATVLASGIMPVGFAFTAGFRVLFEKASFELHNVFEAGPPKSTFIRTGEKPETISIPGRNPYEVELRRFVDCLRGEADPALLDADRAIEALTLSVATQRALAQGWTIDIAGIR